LLTVADMDKSVDHVVSEHDQQSDEIVIGRKTGTLADKKHMARLGKEQVFQVSLLMNSSIYI
jgi:hypothetical protein